MNITTEIMNWKNIWPLMRLLLGAFFMLSGILKFWSFASFSKTIAGYNFLTEVIVSFVAYGVPIIEIGFGLLLFLDWHVSEVSLSLLILVFIFTAVSFVKYQNGQVGNCGCFGDIIERRNNWQLFAENTALMIMLGILHFKRL